MKMIEQQAAKVGANPARLRPCGKGWMITLGRPPPTTPRPERSSTFWIGVLVGSSFGPAGMMIYSEWSDNEPDDAAMERTPANEM
jgi:hypothetical protein